jgi:hypothetical protein
MIDVHDPSLPNAGRAGLWSPPAGAAHFDELSIGTLEPVTHPTELLPFLLWTQPELHGHFGSGMGSVPRAAKSPLAAASQTSKKAMLTLTGLF